jgi:hypothetical protein
MILIKKHYNEFPVPQMTELVDLWKCFRDPYKLAKRRGLMSTRTKAKSMNEYFFSLVELQTSLTYIYKETFNKPQEDDSGQLIRMKVKMKQEVFGDEIFDVIE